MSVVCSLTPVVVAATWPALSAAVTAAATALGYTIATQNTAGATTEAQGKTGNKIEIDIDQCGLVSAEIGRDQNIRVHRDGVTVTFSRDARGRTSLHASGNGIDESTLRQIGEELARGVVQHYVYQQLKAGLGEHNYMVVEEETSSDRSIRLKVRQWTH